MTVKQLIELLQTFPPDMTVITPCHSEYVVLDAHQVYTGQACLPRHDGWVQRKRPDMEPRDYVIIS